MQKDKAAALSLFCQSAFAFPAPCRKKALMFSPAHGSPDRDPVFRGKVHPIAFLNAVEVHKFVILLQDAVDPQIAHRVRIIK